MSNLSKGFGRLPLPRNEMSETGGAPAPEAALSFRVALQEGDNWCWAAVSSSVSTFLNPNSPWTQCAVVTSELSMTCCPAQRGGLCDKTWTLRQALQRTGNYASMVATDLPATQLLTELVKGLPIGVRVAWDQYNGHFLAIFSVQTDSQGKVIVGTTDPIYRESFLPIDDLKLRYQGGGTWSHSYLTQ